MNICQTMHQIPWQKSAIRHANESSLDFRALRCELLLIIFQTHGDGENCVVYSLQCLTKWSFAFGGEAECEREREADEIFQLIDDASVFTTYLYKCAFVYPINWNAIWCIANYSGHFISALTAGNGAAEIATTSRTDTDNLIFRITRKFIHAMILSLASQLLHAQTTSDSTIQNTQYHIPNKSHSWNNGSQIK